MSMPERLSLHLAAAALAVLACGAACAAGERLVPRLGVPVSAEEASRWDLNVFPDGHGLPAGRGMAADGAALFKLHCQICHGVDGRGASAPELAGGSEPLTSQTPDQTIGLYWPYATTLFDLIRRAKPMFAPGTLSADEVYALSAYLLQINGVIDGGQEMNARTLPAVRMPNRDGFVGIDAQLPPSR
jgi:mono/diheme cytochrome c family protein